MPSGTPIRLVKPMRISDPWIAGPMPPCSPFAVKKCMLITGAPRAMTSKSILRSGTIAMITQRRHSR
jgi:hypothetical protein